MSILEQPEEEERTGKREHVIFLMTQTSEVKKAETQAKEDDGREQTEVKEMLIPGTITCCHSQVCHTAQLFEPEGITLNILHSTM